MSYQDLEKALELAPKCKFYTTDGGVSSEDIEKSEQMLGIQFSKQCLKFYRDCGYLSFFGHEIFGIDPNDDSGELEGNSVAYALNDREEYGLPKEWIPIYNYDDGTLAYLDFANLNEEHEPRIILGSYNGEEYECDEVIASDLGEFLLELVNEGLEASD